MLLVLFLLLQYVSKILLASKAKAKGLHIKAGGLTGKKEKHNFFIKIFLWCIPYLSIWLCKLQYEALQNI